VPDRGTGRGALSADPALRAWVEAYVAAWNSNDPEAIRDLFAAVATYKLEPWSQPWRGREQILAGWLENADEPGDTEFEWWPLARDGDLRVLEAATRYRSLGKDYCNLWLVRLDAEGRCTEFAEWWKERPA